MSLIAITDDIYVNPNYILDMKIKKYENHLLEKTFYQVTLTLTTGKDYNWDFPTKPLAQNHCNNIVLRLNA
jgi:hypothetical protein